ncbi:hypothetical protein FPV67DRAFT_1663499 [Lyophyllum atratum]|nr:hypothetical protein FPV67DRAFT_1663499 [Lyophyllum atratum]
MDEVRHPMYAAEPYEEGRDDSSVASPDVLAAFYKDMERKEIVERKLSKRKSNSGTSIWSRKSVKRSATAHPAQPPAQESHPPKPDNDHSDEQRRGEEAREKETQEDSADKPDWVPPMNSPRSIIPDSKDLPAWYNKDAWASVPIPSYKLRYLIHNPVGPRWYKNHHLVPPSETTPAARPPSFFSPSFPPIASSSISQDRSEDATRLPGPSRTPSNSSLPTPNSSQTRVVDKARSRKTSQTAHDNVDLLDVTDPWGTNWHHHSPYDIGLGNGPISIDVQDALHTRSRRSSLTAQSRRKAAPSPLSQSTSAIHLQAPPDTGAHIPRKLSKRRTPTISNIFGSQPQDPGRNAVSLPTTPLETQPPSTSLPKRMSTAPPVGHIMAMTQASSSKKEKRGSVLGRLVKKFSILKKPTVDQSRAPATEDDWQHVISDTAGLDNPPQRDFLPERQPSPEKLHSDPVKRIPPPAIDEPATIPDDTTKEADRSSFISFEAPFSIGRLTIANPDTPGSGETTPAQGQTPLLQDSYDVHDLHHTPTSPSTFPLLANSTEANPPIIPEKTPPPPPTKECSSEASLISSPVSVRPQSLDLQRPSLLQKTSTSSTHHAPLVVGRASRNSVKEAVTPLYPFTSSSKNPLQEAAQPAPRSFDKPQPGPPPPKKTRPISVASSVPFPGAEAGGRIQSWAAYDNSPLSAASMLANPPTPYSNDMPMPMTPEYPPPALPPRLSTDIPSVAQVSRQTETFRLVRSPSGNVYASNETIVAGGQQWEVVGANGAKGKSKASSKSKDRQSRDRDSKIPDSRDRDSRDREYKDLEYGGRGSKDRESKERESRDRKSKEVESKERELKDRESKDQESRSRREKKRESRARAEPEPKVDSRHRHRSQRDQKLQAGERSTSTPKTTTRTAEPDLHHRETSTVRQDAGWTHRRPDERERKSERKQQEASSHSVNVNKAQPAPPAPTPDAPVSRPLGRHPSLSVRPTSQLPSADEMNAMRAKEAWDMERLWKARSMQGEEMNRYTTIPSNHNTPLIGSLNDGPQGAIYGSGHTAFVVQTPFHSQHSIYHSMPTAPPPIIYSSPSSIPTVAQQLPPTHRQSHSRLYSESIASDQQSYNSSVRPPNPLPEPPRESMYEIPASARTSDYWSKYAGVTASH